MSARKDEPQALNDVLKQFSKSKKLEKGLDNAKVEELWSKLLGPGIQSYTESIRLVGDTLYVGLTSSVLREELSYGTENIISMLNEGLQKAVIKKLILR
ncbi:MAG: DUF721 domain-containing protein [Flavobacteriaceae bacterium]|nr:DUF721 domain-containing protein [Flavobacteriaceae bacterium]